MVDKLYNNMLRENGLFTLYPCYSKIDLVYSNLPSKNDSSVIFVAAAAYTGKSSGKFNHKDIADDHVSDSKRYRVYMCKRNIEAFAYLY